MSDNLVIVALPRKNDKINKVSSEKAAHVTLLFLGDNSDISEDIVQYVGHAVQTSFRPIYLETSERGELGPDKADVLFFEGRGARQLAAFRSLLLKDANVKKLYDAQDQYPTFTPHLTLGYPASPATEPEDEWVLSGCEVDRIAVWTADSDGPEFKPPPIDWGDDEVGWSEKVKKGEEILAHSGVKGMKWGVRKDKAVSAVRSHPATKAAVKSAKTKVAGDRTPVTATAKVTATGKAKIKTTGGAARKPTVDAVRAAKAKQVYKQSGPAALSNKQLKDLQTRLNLEKQVKDLASPPVNASKFIMSKGSFTLNQGTNAKILQIIQQKTKAK